MQRSAWAPMYCLTEFFVGGETAGGKNYRAGAEFDGLAVAFADQADDSVIFNDQADAFDAVEITAAETEKFMFETGDGARADILFVDRSKGDFALLIEPDSSRRGFFDGDTDGL